MMDDKYSLSTKVFHTIREDILSGKYRPNEELKEKNIGDEFGVSRTPVREALRQLELEGLVSIIPNKGAYVVGISKSDIQDIYEIRARLEGLCAKWACEHITKEQLDALDENVYLSEFHAEKEGHVQQILELDNKFHEMLYEASKSAVLEHTLSDFHHYVQRVRKITLADSKRAVASNAEHRQIVEALRLGDCAKAEELATLHMMNTIKNMDQYGWDNLLK
ncbi:MAG: GntR family transcriptional regulator [Lachnospiraceae bacterium]|nr:GntR family transcriptional regulator [Lachnospiraceae bacterium]